MLSLRSLRACSLEAVLGKFVCTEICLSLGQFRLLLHRLAETAPEDSALRRVGIPEGLQSLANSSTLITQPIQHLLYQLVGDGVGEDTALL